MKQLFLGGTKSGKSLLAENAATESGKQVIYIATTLKEFNGETDPELAQKILLHSQRRPDGWLLVEEPYALATTLKQQDGSQHCLLVDCLSMWITNLLMLDNDDQLEQEINRLCDTLQSLEADVIFVSNETSLGILPADKLTRRFCEISGELHQRLAQQCERVTLAIAGLAHILKNQL